MTTLLDLTTIVNRLKAQCPALESRVYETVSSNDADLEFYGSPVAMVYLAGDQSDSNQSAVTVIQGHSNSVAVKIGLRKSLTAADKLNSADAQALRTLRQNILTALLGWPPTNDQSPLEHSSGSIADQERYLVWTDTFNTTDYLTNP